MEVRAARVEHNANKSGLRSARRLGDPDDINRFTESTIESGNTLELRQAELRLRNQEKRLLTRQLAHTRAERTALDSQVAMLELQLFQEHTGATADEELTVHGQPGPRPLRPRPHPPPAGRGPRPVRDLAPDGAAGHRARPPQPTRGGAPLRSAAALSASAGRLHKPSALRASGPCRRPYSAGGGPWVTIGVPPRSIQMA